MFTSWLTLLGTALTLPLMRRSSLRLPRRTVPLATGSGLVSVVSVLATLSPLVTVAMAIVLLHERLSRRPQVGLTAAIVGIVLLAAG